jgi:hypothetical protein
MLPDHFHKKRHDQSVDASTEQIGIVGAMP